jgi:hypothetical protein
VSEVKNLNCRFEEIDFESHTVWLDGHAYSIKDAQGLYYYYYYYIYYYHYYYCCYYYSTTTATTTI